MELGHLLSRSHQRLILVYYFVFFALVVPFWWNLTRLDRRALPKQVIHALQTQKTITYPVRFKWSGDVPVDQVQRRLEHRWQQQHPSLFLAVNISAYQRHLQPSFRIAPANATDLPHALWPTLLLLPKHLRPSHLASTHLVAHHTGNLTLYADSEDEALDIVSSFIETFLQILVAMPSRIPFSQSYELLFSYLYETVPTTMMDGGSAMEGLLPYVVPFLDTLLGEDAYTLTSHVQAFAPVRPGLAWATDKAGHALPADQVPHFVNPSWHIASFQTAVHLIHYLPTSSPMYILDDRGEHRPDNDYIVPRWGAVTIVNYEKQLSHAETQSQRTVSHLRTLFGVPFLHRLHSHDYVFDFEQGPHGISRYELQVYQHQHILTSITVSTETLSALVRLVERQTRLPIPEYLRDITEDTCTHVWQARAFDLASYASALRAREQSERAFLDPRMVGMVYFPDEHLYAIYMPLFFPLLVNFLKTALMEWKLVKRMRRREVGNVN